MKKETKPNRFEVLKIANFRNYIIARIAATFGVTMLSTIVFKQVYDLTKDEWAVGLIGAAEFIPFSIVILYAGYLTDIFDRRHIIQICNTVYAVAAFGLFWYSLNSETLLKSYGLFPIYGFMFVIGIVRGFLSPAQSAFMPMLIPKEKLSEGINFGTMVWHFSAICGPAVAGLLYAYRGASTVYGTTFFLAIISVLMFFRIRILNPPRIETRKEGALQSISKGLRFVFDNEIILGSISLDMFAVLFGGAVAMLPAYAEKILMTDAVGYGWLRAAPAMGAFVMGWAITRWQPRAGAGRILLWSVAGFGAATLVFALSSNFFLSFVALALTGAFDNVSMVIRGIIVPKYTPDDMRGRVGSVNGLFIGSSNELGTFESGLAARLMGLQPSVIFGGLMTLIVVALTWRKAPKLRDLNL